jgi:LytS/YehU family sensor histidine kinase
MKDKGTQLLVFLLLGLVEEATVGQTGWFNHRIIAVCAAGLLAGPHIGAVVALFVTWLAVMYDGRPLEPVGISMLCGGLAGGWLYRWRPKLAQHPLTGFCLTWMVSELRDGLTLLRAPQAVTGGQIFEQIGIAPVLQGLGTALRKDPSKRSDLTSVNWLRAKFLSPCGSGFERSLSKTSP